MSSNTEDDDISAFVQDIDTRKPLSRPRDQNEREGTSSYEAPSRSDPSSSVPARSRTMSGPQPMLTTASAVDEQLKAMNDTFLASLQGLSGKRRDRKGHERSSTGDSSTARAPSSGPSTIGRRTLDPLSFAHRQDHSAPLSRRGSGAGINVGLPAGYVRPRFISTGSARSELSIASGEVLGRMDPELDDGLHRRGSVGRDFTE